MAKLVRGVYNLTETHPQLVKEWHPTKNGDLKPIDVSAGSNKKVWWLLPYDDPNTGKHFDFEWQATISNRALKNHICPYLSKHAKVWTGFNDIATTNPELILEWDEKLNNGKKPTEYTAGSEEMILWKLSYNDSKTKKHFEFIWEASIYSRVSKNLGCPYISNRKIWKGFNDLETYCKCNNLEYILNEWDYDRNKNLKPSDIIYGTQRKVNWKCPHGHTYKMQPYKRILYNFQNCNICSREKKTSFPEQVIFFYIKKYFKDAINGNYEILNGKELDIYIPSLKVAIEYDGKQWHNDIKNDLKKNKLCVDNGITLYRIRENGCPFMKDNDYLKIITCKPNNENSLLIAISQLEKYFDVNLDININRDRSEIYNQYIINTKKNNFSRKYPHLAKEWHPTKNGNLTPSMFDAHSNKMIWWLLSYDDPKSGKHFDFEWQAQINARTQGRGCPYLTSKLIYEGFNDLKTTNPQLAKEWHPTKNGELKPTMVMANSNKKVWWMLPYDDPITGKHFDFEWQSTIAGRNQGNGCPYLSGKAILKGFNDLETYCKQNNLEYILNEWDYEKNGNLKPCDVTISSGKKVWWKNKNKVFYQKRICDKIKRN